MRVFAFLLAAVPVAAFDFTFFSDEACATPAEKLKSSWVDAPGAGTVEMDVEFTISSPTISGGAPGSCTELAEEWVVGPGKVGPNEIDDKTKYKLVYVHSCSEYGGYSVQLMTKDYKDCLPMKASDMGDDTASLTLDGAASTCQPLWPMDVDTISYTGSPPTPTITYEFPLDLGGMKMGNKDKAMGSIKVNCNPKPADVAAICLGTLSIVFAFAAIGLAIVAKGK